MAHHKDSTLVCPPFPGQEGSRDHLRLHADLDQSHDAKDRGPQQPSRATLFPDRRRYNPSDVGGSSAHYQNLRTVAISHLPAVQALYIQTSNAQHTGVQLRDCMTKMAASATENHQLFGSLDFNNACTITEDSLDSLPRISLRRS